MTTVSSVRVHRVEVPLLRPFVTAVRTATALSVMLVELVDSDGRSGWGEAPASWRVTGESPDGIRAAVTGPLADVVIGRDILELPALVDELSSAVFGNASARSAVDCALHDLAAQNAGLTLGRFLGSSATSIRTDMTLSVGPIDTVVRSAREWASAGFGTIKVKVAAGSDSVDALTRVRDAVGPGVHLRVDANQAWSPRQAVEAITAWERLDLGIELVEQPVDARSLDDLAFVTSRVSTLVMADEAAWTSRDLLEIVRRRAADLVNLKLAKTRGSGEARRMLDIAAAAGMGVLVGCMMESAVGVAAAASVAAAGGRANGEAGLLGLSMVDATHDLDAGLWQAASPVLGGASYRGDVIELSPAAGLGITGVADR